MTIYSPYSGLWSPNAEEWIAMLLGLNLIIQVVRVTIDTTSKCEAKYKKLLKEKEAEHVLEYNTLVDNFHENDATHVEDYNKLVEKNASLEARISELEEQLAEKSGRTTSLRKRIRRLESRISRNAKSYKE